MSEEDIGAHSSSLPLFHGVFFVYFTYCLSMYIRSAFIMPMILVKKNPRGKVIRELSSEEETAVKTVCGLKKPATMAQHNLANDLGVRLENGKYPTLSALFILGSIY